jgi:hypothetical protein
VAATQALDSQAVASELVTQWMSALPDGGAELRAALKKASPSTLAAMREAGSVSALNAALFGSSATVIPQVIGGAASDVVFIPVTPCRLVDTRSATAGILVAGVARDFDANGANLSAQGGSATGCGVVDPDPPALALTITAVGAAGAGNLRAWATTGAVPNASVVNYALPGSGLNLANTTIVPAFQNVANVNEFTVRADVADVHVVVDVVGYFNRTDLGLRYLAGDGGGGAVDLDVSPVVCQTASYTPTRDERVRVDSWMSMEAAGAMAFFVRNVVSTDGGATFGINLDGASVSRAGATAAGQWAHATNIGTLDLTAGTAYIFGSQTGRISGAADATDRRCEIVVQALSR